MKKSDNYDPSKIESKWQKKWARSKLYWSREDAKKEKFYALDMFPYPSGEGLHVGHPKGYIATDVVSRFQRMNGRSVLHPMGFDAFGLPAENYAIKTRTNPADSVAKNVLRYKKQLELLGFDYDWSREVNTTDPSYYKWTQWIFLQMFKKGLAYQSFEPINWCPSCKTGLANEDVENGRCERCGTLVEKKPMRQWVLRITDYADRLLRDLDAKEGSEEHGPRVMSHLDRLPHVVDKKNPPQAGRETAPPRRTVHALVRNPKNGRFLGLKWHNHPWITFVVGGVEEGEDIVEAARREVAEETGYTDIRFMKFLGGPVKAEYFAAHKNVNRVAVTSGILFELASESTVDLSSEEKREHEPIWMEPKDMTEEIMTCAELPFWLDRIPSATISWNGGVPLFTQIKEPGAVRDGLPFVERNAIAAIVKHWKEDRYIGLKWKKVDWQTIITGAPEGNQTAIEGAVEEIVEETGYLHPRFVRNLGKVESKFFHVPKNVNRHARFDVLYFELEDGERRNVAEEEKGNHEIVWLTKEQMTEFISPMAQQYMWSALFLGKEWKDMTVSRPLLDWPEYIKEAQRNWIGRSEGAEIDFRLLVEKNKPRFVILHGYDSSPEGSFIPWLKKELEARGHEVEVPRLPNPNDPSEKDQVEYVIKNCKLDDKTVVIGHSLGGTLAMRVLMKFKKPISGLVIVAAAVDPEFPKAEERPFWKKYKWDIDYELVNHLTEGKIAVLADTQERFRSDYLKFLANKLSAAFIEVKSNKEHFRGDKEPVVLEAVTPKVRVFTTRPDTIYGVTYMVLAPEHGWVKELLPNIENRAEVEAYMNRARNETEIERTDAKREKTGVPLRGVKAINPANGEAIPVWIADYVLPDYGTGAVMAVPAHDERDMEFAKKYNLPVKDTAPEKDKGQITEKVGGRWVTKYKLRDWVFSRQRYWGEPIPVIHCENCGVVAVPEKDLPVKLPKVKSYEPTGTGESPLASIKSWVNVKCPKCRKMAKRETNTMPQWAGSSWYYLRYEDPKNRKQLVGPKNEKYWSPVDLYVGGAEHATRHLIYARFWHKFLHDIGVTTTVEPFAKLQNVGLIMGEDGRKMSKRFGNVVNPDDIVKNYGADTLRIYEMFMGPFDQQISWSTASMVGSRRFIERIWKLRGKVAVSKKSRPTKNVKDLETDKILNKTVKKVTDDIRNLRFNTAISALMIAANELEKIPAITGEQYATFLRLLAPFAPHVAEELWSAVLTNKKSIHASSWPAFDASLAAEDSVTVIVQVNGRVRGSFSAAVDASDETLKDSALKLPDIKKWTASQPIRKIIVVKNRLINIVI